MKTFTGKWKWLLIPVSLALVGAALQFSGIFQYYPRAVRNSKFEQINLGQDKASVINILKDIPVHLTSDGFPGPQKEMKCKGKFSGLEFQGIPSLAEGVLEHHFVVFFDEENRVCDMMRYGL